MIQRSPSLLQEFFPSLGATNSLLLLIWVGFSVFRAVLLCLFARVRIQVSCHKRVTVKKTKTSIKIGPI